MEGESLLVLPVYCRTGGKRSVGGGTATLSMRGWDWLVAVCGSRKPRSRRERGCLSCSRSGSVGGGTVTLSRRGFHQFPGVVTVCSGKLGKEPLLVLYFSTGGRRSVGGGTVKLTTVMFDDGLFAPCVMSYSR
jgi:hypothetical protein